MIKYYICAALAVLFTAISQILLKFGANKTKDKKILKKYLNAYVILGYAIFFIVTLLNLYAYKYLPIKMAVVFLPFTFVFVALLSLAVLREKMNKQQIISSLIIITGVVIYNL